MQPLKRIKSTNGADDYCDDPYNRHQRMERGRVSTCEIENGTGDYWWIVSPGCGYYVAKQRGISK
jgi:hypothetical protein